MSSADELELLRSTVRALFADDLGSSGFVQLADLGLVGLLVPEAQGGAGWLPVEAVIVADEVGRMVSTGGASSAASTGSAMPWLAAAVAAAALSRGDDHSQLLASTLNGSAPSVAVAGRLRRRGDTVSGSLVAVEDADQALALVIIGENGQLDVIERAAPGVSLRAEPASIDTTRALWRVDLVDAPATSLGSAPEIHDVARLLAAATSLGSLRAALARLLPYLRERIAFGAPIASFQAIQHRIVDLALLETRAGVAVDAAARKLGTEPAGARQSVAVAHAFVAEWVPPALDECIQLTGGIGFTWEYPLHHELRRSVADGTTFGSARDSRELLLTLTGWA